MEFKELKIVLKNLYKGYVRKHFNRILFALILSIIVAGSTSSIAWLLDPAVKKIFIEQDRTLAWLIPVLIIIAFATKGFALYFARINIIRVSQEVSGEIQKKVSQHFNIKMSDMSSARRSRTVARPRQVAMYLSKNLTSRSLPEIGRRFGNRDHTTVIHAVKKVEELRSKDLSFDEDVQLLIRMLES